MSNREHVRTVRVRAIDDTTPVLLGISRTMGGMRREISSLRMMLRLLAADELISAEAAETLGTALSFAIPVIGIAAGLISMLVGVTLTQRRSAIPIGQTLPGQYRTITAGGPVIAHKGEIIGRPMGGGVGGGGDFSIGNMTVNMKPDGESPEAIGRLFRTVRNSYSSDIPMTILIPIVGISSLFGSTLIQSWFLLLHTLVPISLACILGICIWSEFRELPSQLISLYHHVLHKCASFS